MLIRFFNGLNLVGMLSHVFLPMITVFFFVTFSGTCDVILAKYAISLERRQGRRPVAPMPFERVAATIRVMLGDCIVWLWAVAEGSGATRRHSTIHRGIEYCNNTVRK